VPPLARPSLHLAADPSIDSVADDLRHSAALEREHRRAASHRFDHHKTEQLFPLNREKKCARPGQQVVIHGVIGAIDSRRRACASLIPTSVPAADESFRELGDKELRSAVR
jgi:hypothetical protein